MHRYHSYSELMTYEGDDKKSFSNLLRFIAMAFRPINVVLICLCLTIMISIPCVVIMHRFPKDGTGFSASMAVLTGVIASGLVSIAIELANNYRHNRQRFVVLNEYLYMVSMYEENIEWASHGNYVPFDQKGTIDWFEPEPELPPRMQAVADVMLLYGKVMEEAVKNYREYLSVKELQTATLAVDATDKLGDYISDIINNHLSSRQHRCYDDLDEPLSGKIKDFSETEGIYIVDDNLENVVCDYIFNNFTDLGYLSDDYDTNEIDRGARILIIHCLYEFDESMHNLQSFVKCEPIIYKNLTPFDERMEQKKSRIEKKFNIDLSNRASRDFKNEGNNEFSHAVLFYSPSDLAKKGVEVEAYLKYFPENDREIYREFYNEVKIDNAQ